MVSAAKNSASVLVNSIIRMLPGFRDTAVYKGRLIHFYKRAQILVGDLWAAYGRQGYYSRFPLLASYMIIVPASLTTSVILIN